MNDKKSMEAYEAVSWFTNFKTEWRAVCNSLRMSGYPLDHIKLRLKDGQNSIMEEK